MDAKSHPSSLIALLLLDRCSFGLCREHVHKRVVNLLGGGYDIRWEGYVAVTGTRPMIVWVARMDGALFAGCT